MTGSGASRQADVDARAAAVAVGRVITLTVAAAMVLCGAFVAFWGAAQVGAPMVAGLRVWHAVGVVVVAAGCALVARVAHVAAGGPR